MMEPTPRANEKRNQLFQKLKPCCVRISQLAIKEPRAPTTAAQLQTLTNQILYILKDQIQIEPCTIDEKLAEYVFFPLYHIFRQMNLFPMLLVENGVQVLSILIVHGWKSKISPQLVQQIFGLLIFIVGGVPDEQTKREVPEETTLESFRTLTALLQIAGPSAAASGVTEPDVLPTLGYGITVMLDGAVGGGNEAIQKEALHCLQSVYTSLKDQAALASFLPGTMSSLTRILSAPNRYKKFVLVRCIETVSLVLTRVLGDIQTRGIFAAMENSEEAQQDNSKVLSPAWLKATTGQIKIALGRIMKLRTYDASEVRDALEQFCLKLLDECHRTLQDCAAFLVETAVILYNPDAHSPFVTDLSSLSQIYPELAKEVQNTVYNWTSSLSRIMQGADETVKRRALCDISKGIQLTRELAFESSTLQLMLSDALVDSVTVLMAESKPIPNIYSMDSQFLENTEVQISLKGREDKSVILSHQSQKNIKRELLDLLKSIDSASQSPKLISDLLELVRIPGAATGRQVAAFWLCFELVKAADAKATQFSDLMTVEDLEQSDEISHASKELYRFAVEIIDSHSENTSADWRLEAAALEVIAYTANKQDESYRPELVDVLFPTASYLGSKNASLQQQAIITLNGLASACRYGSVSELIVANVDYMVTSVALRLNMLDISPASTQVLTMMIRLAGPRLVPYLDDVVESIFGTLENYHGYTVFVESLFMVLKELVTQAVKSGKLLLDSQNQQIPNHKKTPPKIEGLESLIVYLDRRKERQSRDATEAEVEELSPGSSHAPLTEDTRENEEKSEELQGQTEETPNSLTYQLLLRIAYLTQHYLTSPLPKLRRSLLDLLSIACPALAADENAFLPLVHAIWPVVIARLKDDESFVAIEACHTLARLCTAAGDFLSSRFRSEWIDGLEAWCRKTKHGAATISQGTSSRIEDTQGADLLIPTSTGTVIKANEKPLRSGSHGGLGHFASSVKLWEATIKLLTAMVSYVQLTDEIFDSILDLLADTLEKNDEVREALETANADAVWLVRCQRGVVENTTAPVLEGVTFVPLTSVLEYHT